MVESFLLSHNGHVNYPLTTNDIFILLESKVDDLDVYADLSAEGNDVEGLTDFFVDGTVGVRVARHLSEDPRRENRYRTTLSHELGHVRFHRDAYNRATQQMALSDDLVLKQSTRCKRDTMLNASQVDWLEWQAGYASGSILMPITLLRKVVTEFREQANLFVPIFVGSAAGEDLIGKVQTAFQVSADAARVRLLQIKYLSESVPSPSLFDLLSP
ncbi:MAG: ImmA/IrrE family metallo-endopeptidase [Chloroflexi bacterium]|nr:ImmA/IrrE family metallo-endopeptidase [Chloroflexota bacterium]